MTEQIQACQAIHEAVLQEKCLLQILASGCSHPLHITMIYIYISSEKSDLCTVQKMLWQVNSQNKPCHNKTPQSITSKQKAAIKLTHGAHICYSLNKTGSQQQGMYICMHVHMHRRVDKLKTMPLAPSTGQVEAQKPVSCVTPIFTYLMSGIYEHTVYWHLSNGAHS